MRIESIGNGSYTLFLSNEYMGKLDYDSKEEIGSYLKKIIFLLKETYSIVLNGFYEVNIYINEKLGMFIEIDNIDGYDSDDLDVDLKIVIHFNSEVYFKTDNYDFINNCRKVKFSDSNYYINLDDVDTNEIIKIVEFGEFIYGEDCACVKFLPLINNK